MLYFTDKGQTRDDLAKQFDARDYDGSIYGLSTIVTTGVLNKIIDKTASPEAMSYKRDMYLDLLHLDRLSRIDEGGAEMLASVSEQKAVALHTIKKRSSKIKKLDSDKLASLIASSSSRYDKKLKSVRASLSEGGKKAMSYRLSDSMDLIHTAIATLLQRQAEAEAQGLEGYSSVAQYPMTVHRKRVAIKSEEASTMEEARLSAYQLANREVRAEIERSRAIRSASERFIYLATEYDDTTERQAEAEGLQLPSYIRLPLYTDLGGYDARQAQGSASSIYRDYIATEEVIAYLSLTERQAEILRLRLRGYGKKAIATYLKVSDSSVRDSLRAIQKKATEGGLANYISYQAEAERQAERQAEAEARASYIASLTELQAEAVRLSGARATVRAQRQAEARAEAVKRQAEARAEAERQAEAEARAEAERQAEVEGLRAEAVKRQAEGLRARIDLAMRVKIYLGAELSDYRATLSERQAEARARAERQSDRLIAQGLTSKQVSRRLDSLTVRYLSEARAEMLAIYRSATNSLR